MNNDRASLTSEMGKTLRKKLRGSGRKVWKVGSSVAVDFQGLPPVAKLRRIIPRNRISLYMAE